MSAPTAVDRVVIMGLGLIGGSLAHVLAPHCRVIGIDVDAATRAAARADGIDLVDDVRDAAGPGALVVIAVPVPHIGAVCAQLTDCDNTLVTDVASVKTPVLAAAPRFPVKNRLTAAWWVRLRRTALTSSLLSHAVIV